MKYTHKGWFFMCPVYLNPDDGEEMAVEARHEWLEWWFDVNNWLFSVMVFFVTLIDPEYEPMFPFRITGETKK